MCSCKFANFGEIRDEILAKVRQTMDETDQLLDVLARFAHDPTEADIRAALGL